jgi:hypothetical protein
MLAVTVRGVVSRRQRWSKEPLAALPLEAATRLGSVVALCGTRQLVK